MPLPTIATLTYKASSGWGLSFAQLSTLMASVSLVGAGGAPPPNAPLLPAGTSDAVFDVLFGANIISDTMGGSAPIATRTVVLGLRPAAGNPTASSFVSLGNSSGSTSAPTNNPPFPSPLYPFSVVGAGPQAAWTGSIVSSNNGDHGASLILTPPGARTLRIFYLDVTGAANHEDVVLQGTTPVNLTSPNKYVVTEVRILTTGAAGAAPLGQVNLWSGPVDPVTGLPTGKLVGYLPNSYFTNFSFQQLGGWTTAQLADPRQAYGLVAPDYKYPNATVITPVGTPPPAPSKSLLNYPPPSSMANPNPPDFSGGVATPVTDIVGRKGVRVTALGGPPVPGAVNDPLLTPAPNFTNTNQYLSHTFYGGAAFVPNPFQGLGLGAFSKVLGVPASRVLTADTVSMTVVLS